MRTKLFAAVFFSALLISGCASSGPIPGSAAAAGLPVRASFWGVKSREHVDLWLHGFALLQSDTASPLPLFDPEYRDNLVVIKNNAHVLTQLDVNVERLQRTLKERPDLINAQFLAQMFASGAVMRTTLDAFVAANGDPNAAASQEQAYMFAGLLNYFPTPVERQWLGLFISSLWDEHEKFFASYWLQQQRDRKAVIDSVHSIWTVSLYPRLRSFLISTKQSNGEILLSLPLLAEGRTANTGSNIGTSVAIGFPKSAAEVNNAIYAIAHEVVNPLAFAAIQDNTTPAQQRSGEAAGMVSQATIAGGLILLETLASEYAEGYARFYLHASGHKPGSDPKKQLREAFPLAKEITDNMTRQLETIGGGI